jgi:excisionase family DNA binding protein
MATTAGSQASFPQLMTVPEVAALCRTTVSTVRYWQQLGRLRGVRLGRRRLFTREEVEGFVLGEIAKGAAP